VPSSRTRVSDVRERVLSLETEYAVAFHSEGPSATPDPSRIVEAIGKPLTQKWGIPASRFLINGSKFHHDVGHAEWSLPECRSAREVAVYDKAADLALGSLLREAEAELARDGYDGRLLVVKNNVDAHGHTYGCHENYAAERQTAWLGTEDQLRLTVRLLVPFLVTRQVFCGAGRVGLGPRLEEGGGFQIMQRADFVDETVSVDTTKRRAIVNLGREKEPLATGNFRRLHLILADANMSPWATYLKLGTTGLVLSLLEDLCLGDIPHLENPVAALRTISRDPSCSVTVPLRDGRELTAVQIQRIYLDQAQRYLASHQQSDDEAQLVGRWAQVLLVLEQDPKQLFGKVDWVTKKALMDAHLVRAGLQWSDLSDGPVPYDLLHLDIEYHNLSPDEGLFCRLPEERWGGLISSEEIRQAQLSPPPYTRAKVRGQAIALARRTVVHVEVDHWDRVTIGRWHISLGEPLEFFSPDLYALSREAPETNAAPRPVEETEDRQTYSR